jgi:isopentenyl diphosphate isomerase/L-lactate dehydrogenase-like FMN-dependent dehydrogenase
MQDLRSQPQGFQQMGHYSPYAARLHRSQPGGTEQFSSESRFEVTRVGPQTTIFGQKLKAPLFLAPIGVQGILHPEAELATAKAAKDLDITMVLSTAATRSLEEVAEVLGDAHRWYQLYW